jgi:drug/metabolite transporter (DMT)-like permease
VERYDRPVAALDAPTTSPRSRLAADRRTALAFLGVVVFGGANPVALHQTVLEMDPFWSGGLRFAIAGLVMGALAVASGHPVPRGRGFTGAVLYGLVGFAAAFALLNTALARVPGGTASVLIATTPLLTLLLAVAHRQERFHLRAIFGAVIAVMGVAIVFIDQVGFDVPPESLVLALGGAACIGEGAIIVRGLPRNEPLWTNALGMLTGAGVLLALAVFAGEDLVLPTRASTWIGFGYLVSFGSVAVFALTVFTLRTLPASIVAYQTLFFPFVGLTIATLLTGERFSLSFVLGGVVMLAGVYVGAFSGRPRRLPARSSPSA